MGKRKKKEEDRKRKEEEKTANAEEAEKQAIEDEKKAKREKQEAEKEAKEEKTKYKPLEVQAFLSSLASKHGVESDQYLRARTRAEWEELVVSMADQIRPKAPSDTPPEEAPKDKQSAKKDKKDNKDQVSKAVTEEQGGESWGTAEMVPEEEWQEREESDEDWADWSVDDVDEEDFNDDEVLFADGIISIGS